MQNLLLITLFILILSGKSFCQTVVKHILLEEFSTAPCGFCPDGDIIAAQIISNHPNVIWLTHHAGFGTDSMTVPESVTIANAFTCFAPGGVIDRGYYNIPVYTMPPYIAVSRQKWDSVIVAHLNDTAIANVVITNQFDTVTRLLNCNVDVTFLSAPASGDLRLNLFLIEDSVVGLGHGYDQKSYFNTTVGHPFYGMGDTIIGYVHHRVVRKILTGAWGLSGVIPNTPVTGTTYSQSFSNIPVKAGWKSNDIDLVAFVSYYNSNAQQRQVINSNHQKLNYVPTSVNYPDNSSWQFSIYPNPADEKITITLSRNLINSEISIYDILGNPISSYFISGHKNTLDVSFLKSGVYILESKTGNKVIRQKFIKR